VKLSEMRKIVMLAVVISVLIASLPSANASSLKTHPSGPQWIKIVGLGAGLSVGHKDVTVKVKISGPMGNTILLQMNIYYDADHQIRYNPWTEHGGAVSQQTVTLTLTVNPNNSDERTGTVTISGPLNQGDGYYLYVVQGFNVHGRWLGQDWIDPREGTTG
jgi:hypothetical protein